MNLDTAVKSLKEYFVHQRRTHFEGNKCSNAGPHEVDPRTWRCTRCSKAVAIMKSPSMPS